MKFHLHTLRVILFIPFLGFIVLCSSSCKKFVQIPDAPNALPTSAIFADSADATAAILGIYVQAMGTSTSPIFFDGQITIFTGLASDELYPSNPSNSGANSADLLQFYVNGISPTTNQQNPLFWTKPYLYIYQANACIAGINASTGLSTTLKNQLLGEALVLRAYCYFNAVNLFGSIPLVTTTNYQKNAVMYRTSTDTIYLQIVQDLSTAEGLLTPDYPIAGKIRPNQYTASALLAKAYLYMGQWANAETEASKVINSGAYALASINNVFLAGSSEAIWQLLPLQSGCETSEGFAFLPGYGYEPPTGIIPTYSISNFLLSAFESGDIRRTNWIDSNTVNNTTYYYPYKYKLGYDGVTTPLEDLMVSRLGEVYLIRAEAEAQLGQLMPAVNDLNPIRGRASLAGYSGPMDQRSVLNAVYHERQVELFCEMGNRWFDLKRTSQVDSVMSVVAPAKNGSWSADWDLFPVPYSQIQLNTFLSQNPGYPL